MGHYIPKNKIKLKNEMGHYIPKNKKIKLRNKISTIDTPLSIPVDVSVDLLKRYLAAQKLPLPSSDDRIDITKIKPVNGIPIQGVLTMEQDQIPKLMDVDEAIREANLPLRELTFDFVKSFDPNKIQKIIDASSRSDIRVQALESVDR